MASTSHFETWLASICLGEDGPEDVLALHSAIKHCHHDGRFQCERDPVNGGKLVTPLTGEKTLILATEKAEQYFLELVRREHCKELDVESWASFQHAVSKAE